MQLWRSVHRALYDALSSALSGSATVYDWVPPNAAYPYVDLSAQTRHTSDTMASYGHVFEIYPAVYSQYKGPQEARDILDTIYDALHNARLTLTTGHAVRCRITELKTILEPDGRTYQGGATVELFVVT
jgi:hypothetical protein